MRHRLPGRVGASVVPRTWSIALLLTSSIIGCGDKADQRISIHGNVTFKGEPIADGVVSLLPVGSMPGPPISGLIQAGQYSISEAEGPTVGNYRVEIEGFRKTGRKIPDMASPLPARQQPGIIEEKMPYIPAKFNTASALTVDVTTETKELDFDLKP